ncbi:phenylacetate--CoA ligase family protein [Laceyella putida]|uniref:Phenylacetate-coenzyme A ligase n=1 Tax=Laceyella putida TaxID=110101 RepID=A0ABW2RH83_9BACL
MYQPAVEAMERQELTRLQEQRLRETVQRVYAHVPFYRAKLQEVRIDPEAFRGLAELERLPFTCKKDLRDQYPFGLFAVPLTKIRRLHASSGTKGKPTVVGYSERDLRMWSEVCARAMVAAGGKPGDVFHNAYGYGLFTGGLGMHAGAERLGMVTVPVSGGGRMRQMTLIEDFCPDVIAGTPSFILSLGEAMIQAGKHPHGTSVRVGVFGAEPWSDEMRKELESVWGIHAVDIYGLSEVVGPGVAIECWQAKEGLHIAEDHFLVEVIDPLTGKSLPEGEVGELVFTTLTKEAFPILRYRTGDLASVTSEPCRCGRTHRRMSRIKGRIDDMLIIRGVNVFPMEIEPIVMAQPELSPYYQLVVEKEGALDRLTVEVEVSESSFNMVDIQALTLRLEHTLKESLGIAARVRVTMPGALPRSEGKAVRILDRR